MPFRFVFEVTVLLRARWPCSVRRMSAAARIAGNAGSNRTEGRDVRLLSLVCCEGSGPCNELITRSEEPYGLCVCVCDLETSKKNKAVWARVGLLGHSQKNTPTKCCL
jgi:hypothetical protein